MKSEKPQLTRQDVLNKMKRLEAIEPALTYDDMWEQLKAWVKQ